MDWQQIRAQYPQQCVVVEAFDAYEHDDYLVVNELVFVADFGGDGSGALKYTSKILKEKPRRTYIFYHTANPVIEIEVINQISPRWLVDEEAKD